MSCTLYHVVGSAFVIKCEINLPDVPCVCVCVHGEPCIHDVWPLRPVVD